MRKMTLLTGLLVALAAGAVNAGERPSKIRYVFYIAGQPAGYNVMTISESSGVLVIETEAQINFGVFTQDFTSRTEVDAKTYEPQYFSWKGEKMGRDWSGTVTATEDTFEGEVTLDGDVFPSSKRVEGGAYFFENYVTAHQMLILDMVDNSDDPFRRMSVLMPSDYLPAKIVVSLATEVEFTETLKPLYCKRYVWQMENSEPFYAVYDPERRIPVYVDFPATRTEVFLASDYSEKPKTKYQLTEEEKETMKDN